MHIDISAQHTELTDALDNAVREKFQRLQEQSPKPLRAHVILSIEGGRNRVNATVNGLGEPLVASSDNNDMYTAINEVSHLLSRQMRKRKTAILKSKRQESASIRKASFSV